MADIRNDIEYLIQKTAILHASWGLVYLYWFILFNWCAIYLLHLSIVVLLDLKDGGVLRLIPIWLSSELKSFVTTSNELTAGRRHQPEPGVTLPVELTWLARDNWLFIAVKWFFFSCFIYRIWNRCRVRSYITTLFTQF